MYITSQRVVSPARPREGINAFLSLHGHGGEGVAVIDWENPRVEQVAEEFPGVLVDSECDLRPGGNRVRSFLDVVARDGTPLARIKTALDEFGRRLDHATLPLVEIIDGVGIRFNAEPALELERLDEFGVLRNRILLLLGRLAVTPASSAV
jgi:hypothetical protein